ncbi:MAG TPA: Flp family type IVb pilin [Nocardioides sp.]|nr:Flp family type IVb pilin [Nocardioides sp.]
MHAGTRAWQPAPADERGATAVEYALMMMLIAVAIIGAVALFGDAVVGLFEVDFTP